jgi:hypothetical protein
MALHQQISCLQLTQMYMVQSVLRLLAAEIGDACKQPARLCRVGLMPAVSEPLRVHMWTSEVWSPRLLLVALICVAFGCV